jgi:anti-sigma factor RsiW
VKHPGEIQLALFAGGDLGLMERLRVRKHVRDCEGCRSEVEALRSATGQLREVAENLPDGVNWTRLSQEMTGNIRVGLAAGECVGPEPRERRRSLGWHAAAVMAAAFVIGIGGMLWKMPPRQVQPLPGNHARTTAAQEGVMIEASQSSIDLTANGSTMSFLNAHSDSAAVSVSMQGSARAQYVDSDTGQVTINKVYYAQ